MFKYYFLLNKENDGLSYCVSSTTLYSDPQDLNNDEYIRALNTRFPPTTSGRVPNSLSQKSPLSPHRETLKFSYVTNIRQRTASVATGNTSLTSSSTITTIPEAPPLPTNLTAAKQKGSWPSTMAAVSAAGTATTATTTTTAATVTSTTGTSNSQNTSINSSVDQANTAQAEVRRRKTSASDARSPKRDADSTQTSIDLAENSAPGSPISSSSSTHFIQRTLNQHALQTIAKGRLRHLGYMTANITDFDLVSWLKAHKFVRKKNVSRFCLR